MLSLALTTSVVGTTGRNQMSSKAIKTQFVSFNNLNTYMARSHLATVGWRVMLTGDNIVFWCLVLSYSPLAVLVPSFGSTASEE